jgi:hypothetical protein
MECSKQTYLEIGEASSHRMYTVHQAGFPWESAMCEAPTFRTRLAPDPRERQRTGWPERVPKDCEGFEGFKTVDRLGAGA